MGAGFRDLPICNRSRIPGREIKKVEAVTQGANRAAFLPNCERSDLLRSLPRLDLVGLRIEPIDARRLAIDPVERFLRDIPYGTLAELGFDGADLFDCDGHGLLPLS